MVNLMPAPPIRRQFLRGCFAAACCATVCVALSGCTLTSKLSELRDAREEKAVRRLATIDDVKGPTERILQASASVPAPGDGSLRSAAGQGEFDQAMSLLKAGEARKGQSALKKVAKKYKESPVAEDALFELAELNYRRGKYAAADDAYGQLVKQFPSTRYMNQVARRKFTIARVWLGFPDQPPTRTADAGDVHQAGFDDDQAAAAAVETPVVKSKDPTRIVPVLPNFHNRSRPVFDTEGRAIATLRTVWIDDPTGPLADDSLMLVASHYLRKEDYIEADRMYSILREQYPRSPHLQKAFELGSHAKLMAYHGPAYDGKKLEDAYKLTESTLRLYPDHPQKERLEENLRRIDIERARHDWELVQFYQSKRKPASAAIYCQQIIEDHPRTGYADEARKTLAELRSKGYQLPAAPAFDKPSTLEKIAENNPFNNIQAPVIPFKRLLPGGSSKTESAERRNETPSDAAPTSIDSPGRTSL